MQRKDRIFAARLWWQVAKEKRKLERDQANKRKLMVESVSRSLVYHLAREEELLFCDIFEDRHEVAMELLDTMGVDYKTSIRNGRFIIERRMPGDNVISETKLS